MKARNLMIALTAALLTACGGTQQQKDLNPVLTVEGGQIQGVLTDSTQVMVYKGIPYAAPPVGNLRWKKPQSVVPWQGVKVMDTFSAASVQAAHNAGEFYTEEFYFGGDPEFSEDCLYLNVWAPAGTLGDTNAKLPVAMWVHGGAYSAGWGHEITMDGDAWAQRGVILVTINYRLGMLGFLSHPLLSADEDGTSGNYGLYDQIAALKWVRNNIAQFGGDPQNITIFGQSAGASSIRNLCASPLSKGLISKAIIQSIGGLGELIPPMPAENVEATGKAMMDAGGLTTLEQMRAATPQELDAAQRAYMAQNRGGGFLMMTPHVDSKVLPKTFTDAAMDGEIADVPYMLGSTLDDMMPTMGEGIQSLAELRESQGNPHPVYAYRFDRRLPGEPNTAYHSSELWFVFKTLKNSRRPFTAADYALSDEIVDFWTNFAKYGNPNGAQGNEPWHPATKSDPFVMHLDIK